MDFKDIVMSRYAVKKFDGKKIPQKKIGELQELIRFSPSSYNLQPWKVLVIADQKLKEKLSPAAYNQPQITTSSHLLVFCADTDIGSLVKRMEKTMRGKGTPTESSDPYIKMLEGFVSGMDDAKKAAWAKNQVYLALGNALNGAKSLGFDSCPMEGFNPSEFAKILKLPKNIVPAVLAPIGYAADKPMPKTRFEKKEVFGDENSYS